MNILTPYPDTHAYDQALAGDGLHLLCEDWREFKRWGTAVIRTDDLTAEDLVWYQRRFLTEFYTQPKVLWYHFKQLLQGNFSHYFFRPLYFAMKNRVIDFVTQSRPPTWDNYLRRKAHGENQIEIVLKLDDVKNTRGNKILTGKEEGVFERVSGWSATNGKPSTVHTNAGAAITPFSPPATVPQQHRASGSASRRQG